MTMTQMVLLFEERGKKVSETSFRSSERKECLLSRQYMISRARSIDH